MQETIRCRGVDRGFQGEEGLGKCQHFEGSDVACDPEVRGVRFVLLRKGIRRMSKAHAPRLAVALRGILSQLFLIPVVPHRGPRALPPAVVLVVVETFCSCAGESW